MAVQKVGEMRLPQPRLACKQRDAEGAPLYPAQQFQAETLVHLDKIHLWKILHRQWRTNWPHFFWQSYPCGMTLIFRVGYLLGKRISAKGQL